MSIPGLKADTDPGQLVKPAGRSPKSVLCWTFLEAAQTRPTPFCVPEPLPEAAHLAVAQAPGPGLPLGPRPPLKGYTVRLGLPGPHHLRLNDLKGTPP